MSSPKFRNPEWVFPLWILGGIEFIVCLTCLCYSLYIHGTGTIISSRINQSISPLFGKLNFCGVLSFLLCCILQYINIWYYNTHYDRYSFTQTMTWCGTWLCWSTGILMTYLLFLNRIRVTFKNSSLEPSNKSIRCLYVLLSWYFTLCVTSSALYIFLYIEGSTLTRSRLQEIQFLLPIPIAALEITISISMTWIFVSRLYSLILMQTVHHYDESIKSLPGSPAIVHSHRSLHQRTHVMSVLEDTKYHRMIRLSVKTAILTSVSLTSSSVLMAFRASTCVTSEYSPMGKITSIWIQMDTMISCICLVLFLPRTQRGFDSLCCCCSRLLSEFMKKLLQKSTVKSLHVIETSRAQQASPFAADMAAIATPPSEALEECDIGAYEYDIANSVSGMECGNGGITPMATMETYDLTIPVAEKITVFDVPPHG